MIRKGDRVMVMKESLLCKAKVKTMLGKSFDKENGEWIEGYLIPNISCDNITNEILEFDTMLSWIEGYGWFVFRIDPDTICRYTGFKDVISRLIFSGDEIESYLINPYVATRGTIEWDGETGLWGNRNLGGLTPLCSISMGDVILTGKNIYDKVNEEEDKN